MTTESVITWAFLLVSVLALGVQTRALHLIRRAPARPGLIRTARCRVAASTLYVAVGLNAATTQYAPLQVAFAAFVATQLTWQINAWLDVRLTNPDRVRIQITITRRPRPSPYPKNGA